jgi:ubiquinol-cytochrome c reductase cytochrome b subunit
VIARAVRWLDSRSGTAPFLRKTVRYVFPDHWSFLLGEVALYAFVVLVGTGVFLTFFFEASSRETVYTGSYEPLAGARVSQAYDSAVRLSLDVKAGLLMRQTHHWAANVFVVAIVLHMLRIFFTGAFRKPRELTYYIGVTMLGLAVLEGFLGYSLLDDLVSGMGLAIAYSVVASIPFVGANLAIGLWGGEFPGADELWSRLYVGHVLILPVAIGVLLGLHLALVALRHHTQFLGSEQRVVGTRLWPSYAPRSLALLCGVVAVLFLMGGLVQINPVWLWGPYDVHDGTNGAQPDWYLGWLIGALRITPSWEPTIAGYTLVPNAFWGGAAFPLVVFSFLYLWPAIERRVTGDDGVHNLLDRPRDAPWRTAVGAAFFTWVALIFLAGSADRLFVQVGIPYAGQVWFFRIGAIVFPVIVFLLTRRICEELRAFQPRAVRVRRRPDGGFEVEP